MNAQKPPGEGGSSDKFQAHDSSPDDLTALRGQYLCALADEGFEIIKIGERMKRPWGTDGRGTAWETTGLRDHDEIIAMLRGRHVRDYWRGQTPGDVTAAQTRAQARPCPAATHRFGVSPTASPLVASAPVGRVR